MPLEAPKFIVAPGTYEREAAHYSRRNYSIVDLSDAVEQTKHEKPKICRREKQTVDKQQTFGIRSQHAHFKAIDQRNDLFT